MAYQTALTIKDALEGIQARKYLLPAIQREFVWKPGQIEELLDSLMRGYPIGAFLFWEVAPENADSYAFFEFIADYDERNPHNTPASVPQGQGVTAILDGQQRLTALNIALRGSHTTKLPRMHTSNPKAYPKRELYIDLIGVDRDASPDDRMYNFRFLSKDELAEAEIGDGIWFRVRDVLAFDPAATDVFDYLHSKGVSGDQVAHGTLHRLTQTIHLHEVVSYYLEKSTDLDKVLNIFIRVNSGGTQLSYSDLLLSVATAKWSQRDARQEIHDLVDQINDLGQKFKFSKDRILKASLLLGDFADIKFKAANFKLDNMLQIENQWDSISDSLLVAAQLLSSFGLSSETLTAENVLLPVAYYMHRQKLDESFVQSNKYAADRSTIRLWVMKSLLRTGFWTGAVDTVLITTREVIREHGANGFPSGEIEDALRLKAGKSLIFEDEEIEDLLDTSYKHRRVALLLSLLYPWVEMNQVYHQDHVFPRKVFKRTSLKKLSLSEDEIDKYRERMNCLANLQLLPGLVNQEKSSMMPLDWTSDHISDDKRTGYLENYDLQNLPSDMAGFQAFYEQRRGVLRDRLASLLKKPREV